MTINNPVALARKLAERIAVSSPTLIHARVITRPFVGETTFRQTRESYIDWLTATILEALDEIPAPNPGPQHPPLDRGLH